MGWVFTSTRPNPRVCRGVLFSWTERGGDDEREQDACSSQRNWIGGSFRGSSAFPCILGPSQPLRTSPSLVSNDHPPRCATKSATRIDSKARAGCWKYSYIQRWGVAVGRAVTRSFMRLKSTVRQDKSALDKMNEAGVYIPGSALSADMRYKTGCSTYGFDLEERGRRGTPCDPSGEEERPPPLLHTGSKPG